MANDGRNGNVADASDSGPANSNSDPANHTDPDIVESGGEIREAPEYDTRLKAETAYDLIRRSDTDTTQIAENLRGQTLPNEQQTPINADLITRIKSYLFIDESLTRIADNMQMQMQFDASGQIAQAWIRMATTGATNADLQLLAHEYLELTLRAENPNLSYAEAHQIAQDAHPWATPESTTALSTESTIDTPSIDNFLESNGDLRQGHFANADPRSSEREFNNLISEIMESRYPGAYRALTGHNLTTQPVGDSGVSATHHMAGPHAITVADALQSLGDRALGAFHGTRVDSLSRTDLETIANFSGIISSDAPSTAIRAALRADPIAGSSTVSLEQWIALERSDTTSPGLHKFIRVSTHEAFLNEYVVAMVEVDSEILTTGVPLVVVTSETALASTPGGLFQHVVGGLPPGIVPMVTGVDNASGARLDTRPDANTIIDVKFGYANVLNENDSHGRTLETRLLDTAARQVIAIKSYNERGAQQAYEGARDAAAARGETTVEADRAGEEAASDARARAQKIVWVFGGQVDVAPQVAAKLASMLDARGIDIEVRSHAQHDQIVASDNALRAIENKARALDSAKERLQLRGINGTSELDSAPLLIDNHEGVIAQTRAMLLDIVTHADSTISESAARAFIHPFDSGSAPAAGMRLTGGVSTSSLRSIHSALAGQDSDLQTHSELQQQTLEAISLLSPVNLVSAVTKLIADADQNQLTAVSRTIIAHVLNNTVAADNSAAPGAQSQPASQPDTNTGTASAIPDTQFRGDARQSPHPRSITHAIGEALSSDPDGSSRLAQAANIASIERVPLLGYSVTTSAGNTFNIKVQHGTTVDTNGRRSVASFKAETNPKTGRITHVITISDQARVSDVGRALAHELAEIGSFTDQNPAQKDALTREISPASSLNPSDLSPHDMGRLAEVRYVAETALRSGREGRRARSELRALLSVLGLDLNIDGPPRPVGLTDLQVAEAQTELLQNPPAESSDFGKRLMAISEDLWGHVILSGIGPIPGVAFDGTPARSAVVLRNMLTQVGAGLATATTTLLASPTALGGAGALAQLGCRALGGVAQSIAEIGHAKRKASLEAINASLSTGVGSVMSRMSEQADQGLSDHFEQFLRAHSNEMRSSTVDTQHLGSLTAPKSTNQTMGSFGKRYATAPPVDLSSEISLHAIANHLANQGFSNVVSHLSLTRPIATSFGAVATAIAEYRLALENERAAALRSGAKSQIEIDQARVAHEVLLEGIQRTVEDFWSYSSEVDAAHNWDLAQQSSTPQGRQTSTAASARPTIRPIPDMARLMQDAVDEHRRQNQLPISIEQQLTSLMDSADNSRPKPASWWRSTALNTQEKALQDFLSQHGLTPDSSINHGPRHQWFARVSGLETAGLADRVMEKLVLPSGVASWRAFQTKGALGAGVSSGATIIGVGIAVSAGPFGIMLGAMGAAAAASAVAGPIERKISLISEKVAQDRNPLRVSIPLTEINSMRQPVATVSRLLDNTLSAMGSPPHGGVPEAVLEPIIKRFGPSSTIDVAPVRHRNLLVEIGQYVMPTAITLASGVASGIVRIATAVGFGAASSLGAVGNVFVERSTLSSRAQHDLFVHRLDVDIATAKQQQARANQAAAGGVINAPVRPISSTPPPGTTAVQSGRPLPPSTPAAPGSQTVGQLAQASPTPISQPASTPAQSNQATRLAQSQQIANQIRSSLGLKTTSNNVDPTPPANPGRHRAPTPPTTSTPTPPANPGRHRAPTPPTTNPTPPTNLATPPANPGRHRAPTPPTTNPTPPTNLATPPTNPGRHRAPTPPTNSTPTPPANPAPPPNRMSGPTQTDEDRFRRRINSTGWREPPNCRFKPGVPCICSGDVCPYDSADNPVKPPVDDESPKRPSTDAPHPIKPLVTVPQVPIPDRPAPDPTPETEPTPEPTTPGDQQLPPDPPSHHENQTHPGAKVSKPLSANCIAHESVGKDAVHIGLAAAIRAIKSITSELAERGLSIEWSTDGHTVQVWLPNGRHLLLQLRIEQLLDGHALHVVRIDDQINITVDTRANGTDLCLELASGTAALIYGELGVDPGTPVLSPGGGDVHDRLALEDRQAITVLNELSYELQYTCEDGRSTLQTVLREELHLLGLDYDQPGSAARREFLPSALVTALAELVPGWNGPDSAPLNYGVPRPDTAGRDNSFWEKIDQIEELTDWPTRR